jgi:protein involved in polysaccharide export with SLBB domain
MTLTQALSRAGGISSQNKRPIVRVYRRIPGTAMPQKIEVRFKDIENGKAEDLALQPNDIIEIAPRKKRKNDDLVCILWDWSLPTAVRY